MQDPITAEKGYIYQEKRDLQFIWDYPIKNKEARENLFLYQKQTRTHKFGAVLAPFTPKEQEYSDLTGIFPIKPSQGNKYILFIYNFDRTKILLEPLN